MATSEDSYFDLEQGRWTSWEDLMEVRACSVSWEISQLSHGKLNRENVWTYIYIHIYIYGAMMNNCMAFLEKPIWLIFRGRLGVSSSWVPCLINAICQPFAPPPGLDFNKIFVPTIDTTRYSYLATGLAKWATDHPGFAVKVMVSHASSLKLIHWT